MSVCVLPHALLGSAAFVPAGMLSVGGVRACGVEGVGWRLLLLTDCGCVAVLMCGWDASGNNIGDAGAVALAKALESGQCQLNNLNLSSECLCVAACAAGLCGIRSGCHALGRWCVCACGAEGVGGAC